MNNSLWNTNSQSLSNFEFSHFCRYFPILFDSCRHSLLIYCLSVFRRITAGNNERRYMYDQKGQYAVLAADSYVHVTSYNYGWTLSKFKARYFVINETGSDGRLIFM